MKYNVCTYTSQTNELEMDLALWCFFDLTSMTHKEDA